MKIGVLFPGQGSQFVGMGAGLFEARPDLLGEAANEIVGFDLRSLCLDGPEEDLTKTEHAQPALFALSYALWSELAAAGVTPSGAAGHSLGEYTALAASAALEFSDALAVVTARGRAMAEASGREPSGMAALIGAEIAGAEALCSARSREGGRLQIANVNAPGQIVVAGGEADLRWVADNAKDFGIRRAIPLKVAGAFHSTFMEPAAAAVEEALSVVKVTEPAFPVWANTTARPHTASDISDVLARQMVEPVLFAETLVDMAASGIDGFVHIGPGDVTAGLVRRTLPDSEVFVVSEMEQVGNLAADLVTIAGR